MAKILLVHQCSSQLVPGEVHALTEIFGGKEIEYTTTNPQDPEEHARDCERIKPTFVLLPFTFDTSIPHQALGKGFRHILVSADGVFELHPSESGTLGRNPFKP